MKKFQKMHNIAIVLWRTTSGSVSWLCVNSLKKLETMQLPVKA